MTFTSFSPIQIQQTNRTQQQPLVLKQGQVFHGTIKKLYPDQMAEVQIGQTKFFAKLETPLKAGDSHFFQVTGMNPQAELKVVSGPIQQSQTVAQQVNQLLEMMNLPKTAEMQQLVAYFLRNQLPLSKEQLIQAENWLNNLPANTSKQEGLQAIQKMVEMKMPFTNEIFKGFLFGSKTTGMSNAILNFTILVMENQTIPSSVKSQLMQQLQTISKPFSLETGGVVLSKAIQTLVTDANSIQKTQLVNFLKAAEIFPKNATIENWISESFQQIKTLANYSNQSSASQLIHNVVNAKPNEMSQMVKEVESWISNQNQLQSTQKIELQHLLSRFETLPLNKGTVEWFAQQLHKQLIIAFSENTMPIFSKEQNSITIKDQLLSLLKPEMINTSSPLLNLVKIMNESSQPVLQNMLLQAEAEVQKAIDSKAIEQALKMILKGLGMSYEASFNSKVQDFQEAVQSLKPQLLTIINDSQTSQALKDAADNIVSRLNGMQLLSGENGHQHQLIMQIPLHFLGKQTEATIQWNGRMKENGKIDANYARILFYLNMDAIKETVVDMQVQNRIITLHLYNDHPQLEQLAEPLKEMLKTGLLEKNYHLSGIFIKPFEKTVSRLVSANTIEKSKEAKSQNGVDIRI
ncbi:hypothetical protein [Lysinibacillus halotolerans]|uniref:Flagellar hook-length control protein FliK n=1 Tax=Lysinibacillus halotolerans TaxID=1368476 RepID=A0A3M8HH18_9BACI|nr:hypothetical protein [Lysinibacillus halotolerans]RND01693.1 hypothetical protein EC501_00550 [Lysinibacillus halotolerans]